MYIYYGAFILKPGLNKKIKLEEKARVFKKALI